MQEGQGITALSVLLGNDIWSKQQAEKEYYKCAGI